MSSFEDEVVLVAQGAEWWLEREAGNSTVNRNSGLDDLPSMRQSLLEQNDPKISGHISRMELWLPHYEDVLRRSDEEKLVADVAFGALMFLSGNYRRQRILQAANQQDYFERKMFWQHPYGINVVCFLPDCLAEDKLLGVTAEDVRRQGAKSIETTQEAFKVIYNNVPNDFGKAISGSVEAISHEEESWLSFLSKVLTYASKQLEVPLAEVPILGPTTFAEAKKTTLAEVFSSMKRVTL